jgi:hypothetical protein
LKFPTGPSTGTGGGGSGLHTICGGNGLHAINGSALCEIDDGDGLHVIVGSVLCAIGQGGCQHAKGFISAPRRLQVCFGSLGPITWDFGRRTLALVWNKHYVWWSVDETAALHLCLLLDEDGDSRCNH